ncbi:hypothetical protein [Paenibacillus chitinolyticus]|uniref:hypothetical protein n=1 Tax=Paenibacillus chitinolyticus TaxID=79263 RepID=UPI00295F0184|nr:hypothetical protein [Paenibacillus chitinolyticus]
MAARSLRIVLASSSRAVMRPQVARAESPACHAASCGKRSLRPAMQPQAARGSPACHAPQVAAGQTRVWRVRFHRIPKSQIVIRLFIQHVKD